MKNSKINCRFHWTRTFILFLCLISVSLMANAAPAKSAVKKAYVAQIQKMGQYNNNFRTYFLIDISGDGIPELFVRTGTCEADAQIHIYTYSTKLTKLITMNASHTNFYVGKGYFLTFNAHMGDWYTTKYFMQKGKLMKKVVSRGTLKDGQDYPEPKEIGVYEIDFDNLGPIQSM